jgi:flagellar motor switch protein FliM
MESKDTDANAIQVISDHEIVLLVVLEITIDEESGFLSICYPIAYIEPLLEKVVERIFAEGKNKKSSRKPDITTLISGSRMKVESILAETDMSVLELLNITEGDVLVFSKNATSASTKVYINKKEKFLGVSGISNNRKAVQIQSNLDKEKQETLAMLSKMREERERQSKEAAAKLKKINEDINNDKSVVK